MVVELLVFGADNNLVPFEVTSTRDVRQVLS